MKWFLYGIADSETDKIAIKAEYDELNIYGNEDIEKAYKNQFFYNKNLPLSKKVEDIYKEDADSIHYDVYRIFC